MGECHCGLGSERQLFVGVLIWSIYNGAFDQLRLATMAFKHPCRTLFTPAEIPMDGIRADSAPLFKEALQNLDGFFFKNPSGRLVTVIERFYI